MSTRTSARFREALAAALAVALTSAGPVWAETGTVTVSGDSKPSDCGTAKKADYSAELTGSLTGCLATFVFQSNCQEMNGFSSYTELGREEFEGKLNDAAVAFKTQYTFYGKFPSGSCPQPKPEAEIVGGCIHYISGDNLVGLIRLTDVMSGEGAPHFFYEGDLTRY